jgi:AraC family transcriptional activator of tynA and feaB
MVNLMSQTFSTDLVPIADRLDAWLCNARQICGDCRFEFPKRQSFHGSIERRRVAGLELTRFSSTPVSFAKFPIEAANSVGRSCIVITQLQGVRLYSQGGATAILKSGDSTLIDSGRPWSSNCAGECSRLYLRVPRWLIENRLRFADLPLLPRISGASGLGVTLFHLATSLYQEAQVLTPEEGISAIEAYLELLCACVGLGERRNEQTGACAELLSRVEQFIDAHLPEPTMGPTEIADAVGISVRHLHRLFLQKESTVAEYIRERRLERCQADLCDPRFSDRNITEIAFFWGFSDSAHFSHCFKQRFGVSPRLFRSRLWSGAWNTAQQERARGLLARASFRPLYPN